MIDFSQFYRHTIHFKDEASPRTAKPKGVLGLLPPALVNTRGEQDPSNTDIRAMVVE